MTVSSKYSRPDRRPRAFTFPLGSAESLQATWNSTTAPMKPLSHDRLYYFLPFWDEKPTMYVRATFPDHRRRMYQSNTIDRVAIKLVSTSPL